MIYGLEYQYWYRYMYLVHLLCCTCTQVQSEIQTVRTHVLFPVCNTGTQPGSQDADGPLAMSMPALCCASATDSPCSLNPREAKVSLEDRFAL